RMIGRGIVLPPMAKKWSERCVWAPQYRSAGTSIGPIESVSVRVLWPAEAPAATLGEGAGGAEEAGSGMSVASLVAHSRARRRPRRACLVARQMVPLDSPAMAVPTWDRASRSPLVAAGYRRAELVALPT